jgi:hypothetical protein
MAGILSVCPPERLLAVALHDARRRNPAPPIRTLYPRFL